MDPPPVSSTFQSMEDFEKEFGLEPFASAANSTNSSPNNAKNVTMTDARPPTSSTFQTMEDFEKELPPQPYKQSKQQGLGTPFLQSGPLPSPALSAQHSGGTGASTPMSFVQGQQGETVNWVGLLMEYSAQKGNTPPAFSDIPQVGPLEPRFVCSVKIDERTESFVDQSQSFSRKKLAKQFACQLAMVWLAENGYISPLRVPKLPELLGDGAATGGQGGVGGGEEFKSAARSTASRVPEVCKELGITPPAYRFRNTEEHPMVWSGFAVFALNPDIPGEVGQFSNVLGRKNAKEVCAQNVLRYLEGYKKRKEKKLV